MEPLEISGIPVYSGHSMRDDFTKTERRWRRHGLFRRRTRISTWVFWLVLVGVLAAVVLARSRGWLQVPAYLSEVMCAEPYRDTCNRLHEHLARPDQETPVAPADFARQQL